MGLFPTDWPSFLWGLVVGALGVFFTAFLRELGRDVWVISKAKLFPGLRNEAQKRDRVLLGKFLAEFPSGGRFCIFLSDRDVAAPFSGKVLNGLDNLVNNWNDAEHEFLNEKIDKQRKDLWELASKYRPELLQNIFPVGAGDLLAMDLGQGDLQVQREMKRQELNRAASEIFRKHQELIRLANKYT
jgi:hypothetical protein